MSQGPRRDAREAPARRPVRILPLIGGGILALGVFLGSLVAPAPGPKDGAEATRDPLITGAAVLFYLSGFAAVSGVIPTILYINQTGDLPGIGGIRFYGDALFERFWGIQGIMISLVPFAVLGAFEILAGTWLWRSLEVGGTLGLWLTPFAVVFLVGYGAPFFWIVIPLRVILVVVAWNSLG